MDRSLLNAFLIVLNSFFLLLQLISMGALGGYIEIPLLSLAVPLLCIVNIFFFIFWMLRFQWPVFLFLISFMISFQEWQLLYQLENNGIPTSDGLSVLSYNVRSFNRFKWLKDSDVPSAIEDFIIETDPDIICFQEYAPAQAPPLSSYPYKVFKPYVKGGKIGSCIVSKYPLIRPESISFEGSFNGGMQADLLWKQDTLRLYNLHFESFRLNKKDTLITSDNSNQIRLRLQSIFEIQETQVEYFNTLTNKNSSYPEIICTDLNNTAFSKPYQKIKKQSRIDAFLKQGEGFGSTYQFSFLPMRIDFIFNTPNLRVIDFETHDIKLSDHKPISVILEKI